MLTWIGDVGVVRPLAVSTKVRTFPVHPATLAQLTEELVTLATLPTMMVFNTTEEKIAPPTGVMTNESTCGNMTAPDAIVAIRRDPTAKKSFM